MTILSRLRKHRPTTSARDGWHKHAHINNAITCCQHCTPHCRWANMHPGPCSECIREMEASPPLPGCVADAQHRCVTCEALHGVRITHGVRL